MAMVPAAKGKAIAGELEEEEAAACDVLDLSNAVKQLESEMTQIKLLIGAARTRKINNEQLVQYLQELKQLQYDGEDVLDELNYYRLKQQIEGGGSSASSCTLSSDLQSSDELIHTNIVDVLCVPREKRQVIAYAIKETVRQSRDITVPVYQALKLDKLDSVAMSNQVQGEISSSRLTGSYLLEPKVYGRDTEKDHIVELMTNRMLDSLKVLSIVGNGGVGKTTLAQTVCKDPRVKSHFELQIWVCVSHNFDPVRITREMLDYFCEEMHEGITNFNRLQQILEKNIESKRFLLVLDDVWDVGDKWDKLLAPLQCNQVPGNFILVTTRNLSVAQAIDTVGLIRLDALRESDFWLLFKSYACGDEKYPMHRRLEVIGREIAKKLKGYPLGAKTVGALLRNSLSVGHWNRILRDEEWKSLQYRDGIMPALKLSYDNLPYHLQECFSYCSLFPKDHIFHEAELVRIWISQGFLYTEQPSKRLEEIGSEYLADLVNSGFFQYERSMTYYSNTTRGYDGYYVMHDLMHDLACLVSANQCGTLDGLGSKEILPGIRHLSITCYSYRSDYPLLIDKIEKQLHTVRSVRKLRTLILVGVCRCYLFRFFQNIFGEAQRLRLVLLKYTHPCRDRTCAFLDDSICNFLDPCHLRYLKLDSVQNTGTKRQDVSKFYNLQVLDIGDKVDSDKLCNLVSLRHLIADEKVRSTIASVGKMTSLQELQNFKVQKAVGFDIGQIQFMNELAVLRVSQLENIESGTDASQARLIDKSHLNELCLSWDDSGIFSGLSAQAEAAAADVLEALEPHRNLKHLQITGYMGVTSPSWLAANLSVTCLQTLHLENCSEWSTLSSLGMISSLKKLKLIRMKNAIEVSISLLEMLVLSQMPKLERCTSAYTRELTSSVRVLVVDNCPNLKGLTLFQYYNRFDVEQKTWFPSLKELRIENCPQLMWLFPPIHDCPNEVKEMECFPSLCELTIRDCPHVTVSCRLATVANIPYVDIKGSSKLPEMYKKKGKFVLSSDELRMLDDKTLAFGRTIHIRDCPNLISISFGNQECSSIHVRNCPNLRSLSFEAFKRYVSLSEMAIEDCPNFVRPHVTLEANHEVNSAPKCLVFPSLGWLYIGRCGIAGRWISQMLSHTRSMAKLYLTDCPNVKSLLINCPLEEEGSCSSASSSGFPDAAATAPDECVLQVPTEVCSSLINLRISDCPDLALGMGKEGFAAFTSLKELQIRRCPRLPSSLFQENGCALPPSLNELDIDHLPAEVLLGENMSNLRNLSIWDSPQLMSLQMHFSLQLKSLKIIDCEQLAVLEGLQFLSSLRTLEISMSHDLSTTWDHKLREQEEGSGQTSLLLPPSLKNLTILDLTDKIQSRVLSCLPSLAWLQVHDSPNLTSLQLGSCLGLKCLAIVNCGSLSSLEGLQHIGDLRGLIVSDCPVLIPQLEHLFQQPWSHDLCSQLEYLTIDDSSILVVPTCKRLTSLQDLTLGSDHVSAGKHHERVVSLTEEQGRALQCLTHLQELTFGNCPNLLHLPADLHSLPCLACLTISNCPEISRLPEKCLPPSLQCLWINKCSKELNEQCRMAATEKLYVEIDGESVNRLQC